MPSQLFAESSAAFKQVLAAQMGCTPADYESHRLTVVQRPADSREAHLALMTTCGTGSVVSVRDARLADWARDNAPATNRNQRIFLPSFLEGLAAEALRSGHDGAKSHSATGGTVLAEDVSMPGLPPGIELRELSLAEQSKLREGGRFDNALGEPDELRRIAATRIAFSACLESGEVAAVCGVWDQYPGVDELGLDVLREHRGMGLGAALTIYATQWIRSHGRWPIYTYGFTNVRSANNALRSGYRPRWFLSAVFVPSDMH